MAKSSHPLSRTYVLRPCGHGYLTFWEHDIIVDGQNLAEELVLGPGSLARAMQFIFETCQHKSGVSVSWDDNGGLRMVATAKSFRPMPKARELCEV